MNKRVKLCLALFLAFAVIVQYSFSPQAMIAYGEDGDTVTATEASDQTEPTQATTAPKPAPEPSTSSDSSGSSGSSDSSDATEPTESTEASDDSDGASDDANTDAEDPTTVEEETVVDEEALEEEESYPAQNFSGSANGVSVKVSAPKGALPEDTKMSVRGVSDDQVQAAVEGVVDGEVANLKAVDITFKCNGKEIEPKKAVSVHMTASGVEADKVVHVADSGSANVVGASTSGSSASFKAADFSVYIVVETDNPESGDENAVATYEFYVDPDDDPVNVQHVKTGEKLTDPGDLAGDGANIVFLGWYTREGNTKIDFTKTITVSTTETIKVDAKTQKTFYITFNGEKVKGNRAIVGVLSKTVTGEETATLTAEELKSVTVTPEKATSIFKGWATADNSTTVVNSVEGINNHMELYAVVVHASWLRFDENDGGAGGGASYTAPVAVEDGQLPSEVKPADPTRQGYTFGGWYEDSACTTEFEWNQAVSEDKVLYAKWTANEDTKYTVIVWKQKVTDSKTAEDAEKKYDYEDHYVLDGQTDALIEESMYSDYTSNSYTGFHFDRVDYDAKTVANENRIRAKGDTVINVYYDRNLNTINYYTYRNNQWRLYDSMTGLYGQTLKQNGYTWDDTHAWYVDHTGNRPSGMLLTFLDAFKEADTTYNLYGNSQDTSGWSTINHYKENVDGGYPNQPTNSTSIRIDPWDGATWTFSDKYDGFTLSEYSTDGRNWNPIPESKKIKIYGSLYIHYSRNNYSLSFQDDSGYISADELDQMKVAAIPYEKGLSDYEPASPKKGDVVDHHVFQGCKS